MIGNIHATVLFVTDLSRCAAFYHDTLGSTVKHSDASSVWFGDQQILLLEQAAAARLVGEDALSSAAERCPRVLICAEVEDVDAAYAAREAKGVAFLEAPTSQPWGLRAAHFADPEGNLREISHPVVARTQAQGAAAKG